tara:strand:+ start:275 stop:1198 length:924 start_codon:yes stop_codon:yes gene_type:complete
LGNLENHIYHYDNLVIGSEPNAVIFAYLKGYPLVTNRDVFPFRFDYFDRGVDLSKLCLGLEEVQLQEKTFGPSKLDAYKHLSFVLNLAGLCPLGRRLYSCRLKEGNLLKITTKNSRMIQVEFDQLYIFNDENILGLPEPIEPLNKEMCKVFDWIDATCCTTHSHQYFETDDDFVREVYFYPTERLDGYRPDRKDLVAVSYLSKEQLGEYEYSDTYVKFKVLNMMKETGIKGARNGRDMLDKTKYKHYALKLQPQKREVVSLQKNLYDDIENIEFMYQSEEDILKEVSVDKSRYVHHLNLKMADHGNL